MLADSGNQIDRSTVLERAAERHLDKEWAKGSV